jgi:hypothetical protein
MIPCGACGVWESFYQFVGCSKSIFLYDDRAQKVKQIAKMVTERRNMSLCVLQNEIYVVGGEN